ncbi:MAG: matrixin family metalloprotease [Planctomycetales bacterium]|nr:matrixin family metalloprotease [Planctomycetales bacterium]
MTTRTKSAALRRTWLGTACAVVWLAMFAGAHGFYTNGRWSVTATDGATDPAGSPVTVTWSIVPDGTTVPGNGSSDFVAFMDGLYGGTGATVADRPWFSLVEQSFGRWTELGGLEFVYEPADDGATLGNFAGVLGTRGDVRIGGAWLDGIGGTTAQTGFLNNGDITVDTGDTLHFGSTADNSLDLRNTLTHEIGHALGLGHINSSSSAFLMEPFSDSSIDGPQLDDIRGLQQLYGDALERAPTGPNNSLATATDLGLLAGGATIALGLDASTGTAVEPTETDFISIANLNDEDYFAVTVDGPGLLGVTLTPTGANYFERPGFGTETRTQASRISNLSVELYGPGGESPQLLATADSAPLGQPESLADVALSAAGTYYVRIVGDSNGVQLYHLALSLTATAMPGDFDDDGAVDGADFLAWQRGFGPQYDASDLGAWGQHFGMGSAAAVATAVAEPSPLALAALAVGACVLARMRCAILRQLMEPRTRGISLSTRVALPILRASRFLAEVSANVGYGALAWQRKT